MYSDVRGPEWPALIQNWIPIGAQSNIGAEGLAESFPAPHFPRFFVGGVARPLAVNQQAIPGPIPLKGLDPE